MTEITFKTFQSRFLLAPNRLVNSLILGVLAMAQLKYGMTICAVVVLSNHAHLLVVPSSGLQLAGFMQFFKSNLSSEIGGLRKWTGGLFRSRYEDVVVSHERVAHVDRLRYLLSHGVKEAGEASSRLAWCALCEGSVEWLFPDGRQMGRPEWAVRGSSSCHLLEAKKAQASFRG